MEHRALFRYLIVWQVGALQAPADRCVRSLEDALPALVAVHSDRFGARLRHAVEAVVRFVHILVQNRVGPDALFGRLQR